jgi:hypothetical protein
VLTRTTVSTRCACARRPPRVQRNDLLGVCNLADYHGRAEGSGYAGPVQLLGLALSDAGARASIPHSARGLAMLDCDIETRTGELYGVNMRHLRQVILRARERPGATHVRTRVRAPYTEEAFVDAVLRTDDLYVVCVGNRNGEFYFKDHTGPKLVANQTLLGFTGHYNDLGSYAALAVTAATIENAIANISRWHPTTALTSRVKDRYGQNQITPEMGYLLLLILMVSEAARFFEIEQTIANALDGRPNTPLSPAKIEECVHEWEARSRRNDFRTVAIPKV